MNVPFKSKFVHKESLSKMDLVISWLERLIACASLLSTCMGVHLSDGKVHPLSHTSRLSSIWPWIARWHHDTDLPAWFVLPEIFFCMAIGL